MWRFESWGLVGGCWLTEGYYSFHGTHLWSPVLKRDLFFPCVPYHDVIHHAVTQPGKCDTLQNNCHYFQNDKVNEPLIL